MKKLRKNPKFALGEELDNDPVTMSGYLLRRGGRDFAVSPDQVVRTGDIIMTARSSGRK